MFIFEVSEYMNMSSDICSLQFEQELFWFAGFIDTLNQLRPFKAGPCVICTCVSKAFVLCCSYR